MAINLKDVKSGQPPKPPRILLYGEEGIGKSSFGAQAPDALFICSENGLVSDNFKVTQNINPKTYQEFIEVLNSVLKDNHEFKTLVIDTLDWIEPMLFDYICKRDEKKNIIDYGFGKEKDIINQEWRKCLSLIERIWSERNLGIIILAHCIIKPFQNPIGDNFDKYEPKCHKSISGITKEWCDAVLFAKFEIFINKDKGALKAKAIGEGKRVVYTTHSPAWDAKNRYNMPACLPLDYNDIIYTMLKPVSAESIIAEINELLKTEEKTAEYKNRVEVAITKNKTDVIMLKQILNKIKGE
jgi:hypothetical protein